MWIHWCASMLNWYPNTITRFSANAVRNNYRFAFHTFSSPEISTPAFSSPDVWCREFHSRDFHPCIMVPRFPLPRFPLPRIQRPRLCRASCDPLFHSIHSLNITLHWKIYYFPPKSCSLAARRPPQWRLVCYRVSRWRSQATAIKSMLVTLAYSTSDSVVTCT